MRFLRHLPNLLTAARLPAIFLITLWTYWAGPWASAALALFILAALTDIFDGWIARKLNAVTDFGRLMDALVDKIFILGLLVGLAAIDCLPVIRVNDAGVHIAPDAATVLYTSFGVMLILIREFLITGLRLVAARSSRSATSSACALMRRIGTFPLNGTRTGRSSSWPSSGSRC
ncbi:MAG: hypothetical protein CAK86_00935 [Opitutia bacterium AMD-G1]|nr:MAG: hypothetical protein CAK86_00935 [Opitutae bacterium AMD-G1]